MGKVGVCGAAVVLMLANAGCGRLEDLIDDLGGHGGGHGGLDGGCRNDGGGGVCPFTGCAATEPPAGTTLRSVWIAATGEVWTAGDSGLTGRRSQAGGWCWCVQPSGANLSSVWGSSDDDVWMLGDADKAFRWDGAAFRTVADIAPGHHLAAVSGTSAGDVWVAGAAGAIRHFDGTAWSALDASSSYTLHAIWTPDPATVWVAGENPIVDPSTGMSGDEGIALRRTATGWLKTVAFVQHQGSARVLAIDGISATDIWAVGVNQPAGALLHVGDAAHFDGNGWTEPMTLDFFANTWLTGVAAGTPDAPQGAWMVGDVQAVRTDGVGSWTKSDNPLLSRLTAIDARGDAMFAVGPNLTVARWNGADWTQDFGPVSP